MGLRMVNKSDIKPVHPELSDVVLLDAAAAVAPGGFSVSWWHQEVAAGRAPQPVVRLPRCTRWAVNDIRRFWADFVTKAQSKPSAAGRVVEQAIKASAAAAAKRKAAKEVRA